MVTVDLTLVPASECSAFLEGTVGCVHICVSCICIVLIRADAALSIRFIIVSLCAHRCACACVCQRYKWFSKEAAAVASKTMEDEQLLNTVRQTIVNVAESPEASGAVATLLQTVLVSVKHTVVDVQ